MEAKHITLIIKDLQSYFKVSSEKDLAKILGISPQRLNSWKKSNNFDIQDIMPVLLKEGIDLNWLLGSTFQKNALKEPPVDYTAVGQDSTIMKLARSENEVAKNRDLINNLNEELKKIDAQDENDNSKYAALLLEIENLRADKIKAETERDLLLDIIKFGYKPT